MEHTDLNFNIFEIIKVDSEGTSKIFPICPLRNLQMYPYMRVSEITQYQISSSGIERASNMNFSISSSLELFL